MKAFVPSAGKRKRKMKTFRTVVFRLFKTWQWVMTRRDDETLCYAAGFTAPCRHIETVRGINTCSPHCRNSPTEICSFTEKCLKSSEWGLKCQVSRSTKRARSEDVWHSAGDDIGISENIKERDHKADIGVDGFLIFNMIFEVKGAKMWDELWCFNRGSYNWVLWLGYWIVMFR